MVSAISLAVIYVIFQQPSGRVATACCGSLQMTERCRTLHVVDGPVPALLTAGTFAGSTLARFPAVVTMAVSILISFTFSGVKRRWRWIARSTWAASMVLAQRILLNIPARRRRSPRRSMLPVGQAGRRARDRPHDRVSCSGGFIASRARRARPNPVHTRAAVRAARLPDARDLGDPARRKPVGESARQRHLRGALGVP